ncbi:MAG TPA: group II intron reverse transcriptase/maturase [Bacillales bacterium]|nr:group II intron reverse transcriptase/maturase [Bacillales bacterium]
MKGRVWYSLYDKVFARKNLRRAFNMVKANKGNPGIDNITIEAYEAKLEDNLEVLHQGLRTKTYRPKPVKRTMIRKDNGKEQRPLGIPTVEDRIVQAAIRNIIEPIFEEDFLPCSYGFRPNRSAHMAIDQVSQYLKEGYPNVIDADLKSYFDTIPHDQLEQQLRKRVVDGSVIRLIQQFLKAGIMQEGNLVESDEGAPQGGVLSPLLSNVYLHQLDQLMEERGHRIVRYADDFLIFLSKSKRRTSCHEKCDKVPGRRVGTACTPREVENRGRKGRIFYLSRI